MGRTEEQEATLGLEVFFSKEYINRSTLHAQTTQILTVCKLKPDSVLEIGVGNGLVQWYLKRAGIKVSTLDINAGLEPDVVGSITDLSKLFPPESADVVMCCEVVEHLPFSWFDNVLAECAKVSKRYVILSIPCMDEPVFKLSGLIKIPKLKQKRLWLYIPRKCRSISPDHHWEIDSSKETSLKAVEALLGRHFRLVESFREELCSYQRFYVLEKR